MKLLISKKKLSTLNYKDLVPCKCKHCKRVFTMKATRAKMLLRGTSPNETGDFCSLKCRSASNNTKIKSSCRNCKKFFITRSNQRYRRIFCSKSCATFYNNKHKDYGYRRSKLEQFIEEKLKQDFPDLDILFNSKKAIDSELDIYIPSLRLSIELNGIFHYEPIYSVDQFKRIQNNDKQKLIECYKRGIELAIIDTSAQKRFTEKSSQKYYEIVKKLIENNLKRVLSAKQG